jgi:hypothetical protein
MSFFRRLRRLSGTSRVSQKCGLRFQPRLEILEGRLAPAVLTVNTPMDQTNAGNSLSLREAINVVDDPTIYSTLSMGEQHQIDLSSPLGTNDTIVFDPGLDGQTITLNSQLGALMISNNLNILGPGRSKLTISGADATEVIYNVSTTLSITGLTVSHGVAFFGGGIRNNGTLSMTDCTVAFNKATQVVGGGDGEGGGIFNDSGDTLKISDCTFFENTGFNGGAISNFGATLTLSHCAFAINGADNDGGAIADGPTASASATAVVNDCQFSLNLASSGGGIENHSLGSLVVSNSTFDSNIAAINGGGIDNTGVVANGIPATLAVANSTFFNNSAHLGGGGINNSFATATVTNCTLAGNKAGGGPGGGINNSSGLIIANTIVATNTASTSPDFNGAASSRGYNLIGDTSGSTGFGAAGDQIGVDPMLGPLQDNGGPTDTMALLPGSPAIDAGSDALAVDSSGGPLAFDQRGFPRVANGTVDIGAFEVQVYLVYNTADSGGGSLRSALTNADRAGGSVITFATNGTINLITSLPDISRSVQILGPGANNLTVQREPFSQASFSIFTVDAPTNSIPDITVNLSGLTIANGSFSFGGGIDNQAKLVAFNCALTGNSAVNDGGGLYNLGTASLFDCSLNYNSAFVGGGVGNNVGTMLLLGCTLAGNSAIGGGGLLNNARATLTNCTISGNTANAPDSAGGIDTSSLNNMDTETLLQNCTVAGNTNLNASGPGGLFAGRYGTGQAGQANVEFGNTIIADNTGSQFGNAGATFGPGAFISDGFNLSSDASGSLAGPGDLQGLNPLLAPLGNYGGPTPTMALLPGSPAIDDANPSPTRLPAFDQRGFARVVNGRVDIGAFESRGFVLSMAGGNNQQTTVNSPFAMPLSIQVMSPFGEPVQGGVVSLTTPGSGPSAIFPLGNQAALNASGLASFPVFANAIPGSYTVRTVEPANGIAGVAVFNLTNLAGTALSPPSLPDATAGIAYSQALSASGGAGGPYTFAVTAGSLPGGFVLSSSGVLSGSTTMVLTSSFTITATDHSGFTGSQAYTLTVDPGVVASFVVVGFPSPTMAGVASSFSVTAYDGFGNLATNYGGTVTFGSSDQQASLPKNAALTSGTGTFSATFKTAGTQSLTARDFANPSASGNQSGIVVSPAATSKFFVAGFPTPVVAGTPGTFVVIAQDAFGNNTPSYSGQVGFTTSDPRPVFPPNPTLTNGVGHFTATLTTAGVQFLTAMDIAHPTIMGSQTGIVVNSGAATHLVILGPASVLAGQMFTITVIAEDAYGNRAISFRDQVKFTSSDSKFGFAPYTFTASDNGQHNFTGLVLKKIGKQSITVFDASNKTIFGVITIELNT